MNSGDHNRAGFDFGDFAYSGTCTCIYAERERSVGDSHHNDTHGKFSCFIV